MAWTRRQPPPMQIYQDPGTFYDQPEMYQIPAQFHPNPLRPLKNASVPPRRPSAVFDPPPLMSKGKSPSKVSTQFVPPPTAVFSRCFDKVTFPPPSSTSYDTDSLKKKPALSTFNTDVAVSHRPPQKALFTTFPSGRVLNDKENEAPSLSVHSDNFAEFPDAGFARKQKTVRKKLLEAAPIRDRQPPTAKKGKSEQTFTTLPDPSEMPAVEDDGTKPPYSYATLIGMSILRAHGRRLTLSQIYKWISDSFAYYRIAETGWQNSIRHNLSLNKAFVKQERPKDDPGKGNYWIIEAGMEAQFLKDKHVRRSASLVAAPTLPTLVTVPPVMREMAKPVLNRGGEQQAGKGHRHTASSSSRKSGHFEKSKGSEGLAVISSDTTLPASDPAPHEDTSQDERDGFRAINVDLGKASSHPHRASRQFHIHSFTDAVSSPPQINSSPPVMHGHRVRGPTPPPRPYFPFAASSSSQHQSRKRRSEACMDDSGYFSALQSSVQKRPRLAGMLATSEADLDRPKSKGGRAEEEIARIRRSSSHASSPTKSHGNILRSLSSFSSSPIRPVDGSLMLPPLTPATTLKVPRMTLAQIREASPNTNLRQHRAAIKKLVGSPEKGYDTQADLGPNTFFDENFFFVDSLDGDLGGDDVLAGLGDDFLL